MNIKSVLSILANITQKMEHEINWAEECLNAYGFVRVTKDGNEITIGGRINDMGETSDALRAENEKLRKALERCKGLASVWKEKPVCWQIKMVAEAALSGEEVKG